MKVSVEIITGRFIDTEVNENATVKELKDKIATEVKLSAKRLILVVGDGEEERRMVMENEDEFLLRDLGLKEDSHMYLFFKHLDLVSKEDSHNDDASKEEISSVVEEKEEKGKVDGEEEDKEMNSEEDRDEIVEDEEKEKNDEEAKDDDDKDVEDDAREVREGDNKEKR